MANFRLESDWYNRSQLCNLLTRLEEGDLLEFDRGLFKHWAIYVGCNQVVHRTGDVTSAQFIVLSQSLNKKAHVIGEIVKAFIEDEIVDSKVRINNSSDNKWPPKRKNEILEFVKNAVGSDDFGEYDLITNNCEHFANLCRYDKERSKQVEVAIGATVGVAAGIGIILGGMALWNYFSESESKCESKKIKDKKY